MSLRSTLCLVVLGLAATPLGAVAQQNLMKECGAEYQAAKAANTLAGKTWSQFRAECFTRRQAAAQPAAAPAAPAPVAPAPQPAPAAPAQTAQTPAAAPAKPTAPAAKPAPAPTAAPASAAVFPKAVDPKYSTLTPAKQRMKTCLDQYNANKAGNANGGLKWIEKGGGYFSQCNAALKV